MFNSWGFLFSLQMSTCQRFLSLLWYRFMGYKIGMVFLLSRRLGVAMYLPDSMNLTCYFSYSINLPDF